MLFLHRWKFVAKQVQLYLPDLSIPKQILSAKLGKKNLFTKQPSESIVYKLFFFIVMVTCVCDVRARASLVKSDARLGFENKWLLWLIKTLISMDLSSFSAAVNILMAKSLCYEK